MKEPVDPATALAMIKACVAEGAVEFGSDAVCAALDAEIQEVYAAIRREEWGEPPKRGLWTADGQHIRGVLDVDDRRRRVAGRRSRRVLARLSFRCVHETTGRRHGLWPHAHTLRRWCSDKRRPLRGTLGSSCGSVAQRHEEVTVKEEKPIRIEPSKGRKHPSETRVFAREIHESYCADKKCKFYGKRAVQGVCFTTENSNDSADWSYVDGVMQQGEDFLTEIRANFKAKGKSVAAARTAAKAYLAYLESNFVCNWSNSQFALDELIRLRSENAILKNLVGEKRAAAAVKHVRGRVARASTSKRARAAKAK
jgi:hypothetical protein